MPEVVAPLPPHELTDQELQNRLKIQVVDVSDAVQANAVDSAEAHLHERTSGSGVRGFIGKIWHGNIARDYYRQREIQRGRQEIIQTGNIYTLIDAGRAEHDATMAAVVERFAADYIHEGEDNQNFEATEQGQQLLSGLQELVSNYASGELDYDSLIEERTRMLGEYGRQVHEADRHRGLIFADNILEVAANARIAFEHSAGLERLDAVISGRIGAARTGVRTETRLEATDRILDRLHQTRVGALVNETSIALGVATVMTAAKFTSRKAVTAVAAFVGLGVGAGVIAGAREHLRVAQERASHSREMAEGGEILDDSHRREQMEETRYEAVSAASVTNALLSAREAYESGNAAALDGLARLVVEARTRINSSDQQSIDLLTYSDKTSVEAERLSLDIELARAGVVIQEAEDNGILEFDLDSLQEAVDQQVQEDISAKDQAFRRLRRSRTIKMGLIGAATGMLAGLGIQEIHSLVDGGLQGVFESRGGSDRHSLLADAFKDERQHPAGMPHREFFEGGHHLKDVAVDLPDGYHLVNTRPGEQFGWDIVDSNGHSALNNLDWDKWHEFIATDKNPNHIHHIAEGKLGVGWDKQGNLDWETRNALRQLGFDLTQHQLHFHQPEVIRASVERSAHDFLNHHQDEFTHVHRQLWYDNDTPGIYDQNELRVYWGGPTGSGINAEGDYILNMSHQTADGSYHQGLSTNAPELIKDGDMKLALSMTKDTQSHVFMIDVDRNGNAIIPHDSYIGRALFENQNGHAHFAGAYAEVVQPMGASADGGQNIRMLATLEGDNNPRSANDIVQRVVSREHTHFVTNVIATSAETPIEIPPVLPIYARSGLEALGRTGTENPYYGYGAYGGEPTTRRRRAPFARELETNPDANVDANISTGRYLASLRPSYKRTVEKLSKDLKDQPASKKPELVVMIPAAAHQEGRNIYRTLEQYAGQSADKDRFEVVVFANFPKGQRPDQTIREVQRFQKEHPELKVRLIQKQLEKTETTIGWVRKAMADVVISDLLARNIDLNQVLLASNDADSEWIDSAYIQTIFEKAESEPGTDAFLGFIDWSYGAYKAHPETLAATRFMQMIEIYLRRNRGMIGSSGANFVYRPGIYTAVGGYKTNTHIGEDVELGRMIRSARAGASTRRPISFLGRSSEINSSARRALQKLLKDGGAPALQWNDGFSAFDELRTRDFDLVDFEFGNPADEAELIKNTERMLNQTLNIYSESLASETGDTYVQGRLNLMDGEAMRNINRFLSFIGVKVAWQPDGKFKITDASRMLFNLRRWQTAH